MRKGMKRGVSFERQLSGAEIALTTVANWPGAVLRETINLAFPTTILSNQSDTEPQIACELLQSLAGDPCSYRKDLPIMTQRS